MTSRRLEPPLVDSHATHANGILFGNVIVIAGQVGVSEGAAPDSMLEQARLAMRNVVAVVSKGGGAVGSMVPMSEFGPRSRIRTRNSDHVACELLLNRKAATHFGMIILGVQVPMQGLTPQALSA